jgi:integrase
MVAAEGSPARGFTQKFIESLRAREKRFDLYDPAASGLRLRVFPSGVKSFGWVVNSLNRVIILGPWSFSTAPGHLTLAEARGWLERLKAARLGGLNQLDAVAAQLKQHMAPRPIQVGPASGTISAIAEPFLRMLGGQRKRPEEARYIVEKDILPVIGDVQLRSLRKSDCRAVIAKVTARGAKVHAGKVLGLLKQLLDYAENVEDDFINPAARFKAANLEIEHNVRDRWLTEEEIKLFWAALDQDGVPETEKERKRTRAALRLLLLTAVRSAELRLARWTEVDLKGGLWSIPVANQKLTLKQAKQAKPFVVPLGPGAIALFRDLHGLAGESEWVLTSGSESYAEKTLGRAMRRHWRAHPTLSKKPEASPHDLRRTARTWLGKLGIAPHIAERCLNHRLGRIVATYDQGDYLEERRAALEKWDAFLLRVLHPEMSEIAFLNAKASQGT